VATFIARCAAAFLVLVIVAALYRALLFVYELARGGTERGDGYDAVQVRLDDDRRRALSHLREVQFDYDTGKLSKDDYETLTARYESEAAAAFRSLDARARRVDAAPNGGDRA